MPSVVPEPGALALLGGLLVSAAALVCRPRRLRGMIERLAGKQEVGVE